LTAAFLYFWVEIWVEIARRSEFMNIGAVPSCPVQPNAGHLPLVMPGALPRFLGLLRVHGVTKSKFRLDSSAVGSHAGHRLGPSGLLCPSAPPRRLAFDLAIRSTAWLSRSSAPPVAQRWLPEVLFESSAGSDEFGPMS
jgi:hypothetical protein